MTAVLIPAYEPEMALAGYAEKLSSLGFCVVVGDDGSGPDYAPVFSETKKYAKVISFPVNRGKGAMLKSLYTEVLENMPDCAAVITADSDGQHAVEDVCRLRERLEEGEKFVLGIRDLKRYAPFRSRLGNGLSRFVFAVSSSFWLIDNQTGLRGFSRDQLSWMLKVRGDRFDYELSVLWFAAVQGIRIFQLPIQTLYFNNNAKTHFRNVQDTFLLYRNLCLCNMSGVVFRVISLLVLLLFDIAALPVPWYAAMPTVWFLSHFGCLGVRKLGAFKGLPMKGAPRDLVNSLFGLAVTMGVTGLLYLGGAELPISLCWIVGRIAALPLRYFFCKILSQMAFSTDRSSESSVPK